VSKLGESPGDHGTTRFSKKQTGNRNAALPRLRAAPGTSDFPPLLTVAVALLVAF
jgi:hypothetical protein